MTQQLLVKTKTAGWVMTQNVNYVLQSTAFSTAPWSVVNGTLTGGQTDPVAGTAAFRFTATAANAVLSQPIFLEGGPMNRVFSLYIKRITGTGNIQLSIDGATYSTVTINGAWVRYDINAIAGSAVSLSIRIVTNADAIDIYGAQLEDGTTPTTYVQNAANRFTLTQITDADYPVNTVRGCAFLDGRFFVMNRDGEVYQSALEDALTWSSLEFIKSQADPSPGVYIGKMQNYIVTFKDWSTEFFYDAANPVGSILSPVQSAAVQIGCASDGSVQDMNSTLIFLGQTRAGLGRSVYMMQGTTPTKISTPTVEKIINNDNLAEVYSWQAVVGSHQLYGLTLVGTQTSLVYDFAVQVWSKFTYLKAETNGYAYITGISADGLVTAPYHSISEGDIIKVQSTSPEFDGWHVATNVTPDTFNIQATGPVFSSNGFADKYIETWFPIINGVRVNGIQYMQDKATGSLYEFDTNYYQDAIGAIAARLRTPKLDDGTAELKTMGQAELIGDKIQSIALVRYSDDDYQTYSGFRPVDLSLQRSRIRRLGYYTRRAFEVLHVKPANFRLSGMDIT